jgi:hypothetical protein
MNKAFDAFLYSILLEEESGGSLTMLSFLARQGLDPWQEAADYAKQPRKSALAKLSDLLVRNIPDVASGDGFGVEVARLLDLLPEPAVIDPAPDDSLWLMLASLVDLLKTASRVWIRNLRR